MDLNKHFCIEEIQMVKTSTKRYLTSLVIKEMNMNTTMSYYFAFIIMAIRNKNHRMPSAGIMEKLEI